MPSMYNSSFSWASHMSVTILLADVDCCCLVGVIGNRSEQLLSGAVNFCHCSSRAKQIPTATPAQARSRNTRMIMDSSPKMSWADSVTQESTEGPPDSITPRNLNSAESHQRELVDSSDAFYQTRPPAPECHQRELVDASGPFYGGDSLAH